MHFNDFLLKKGDKNEKPMGEIPIEIVLLGLSIEFT